MAKYRAKIELDFDIHDLDRARETVLEFAKTHPHLVSATPGETRDQFARRVVGDDKLVADLLAIATLARGALEHGAADLDNIHWSLTPTGDTPAPDEPSRLQKLWLIAQALSSNEGSTATQLLANDGVQLTVNGVSAEGRRWLITQRLEPVEATAEELSSPSNG